MDTSSGAAGAELREEAFGAEGCRRRDPLGGGGVDGWRDCAGTTGSLVCESIGDGRIGDNVDWCSTVGVSGEESRTGSVVVMVVTGSTAGWIMAASGTKEGGAIGGI